MIEVIKNKCELMLIVKREKCQDNKKIFASFYLDFSILKYK